MAATHTALFIWISLHWQTRLMSTCLHITTCGWIRMDVPVSQCCMLLRKLSHLILQFLKKSCCFSVCTGAWVQVTGQVCGSALSSPRSVSSGVQLKLVSLGGKHLYPLSYLTGAQFFCPPKNFLYTFKLFVSLFLQIAYSYPLFFNWLDSCWFLDYTFKNGQLITSCSFADEFCHCLKSLCIVL